jgi:hypothetical protein
MKNNNEKTKGQSKNKKRNNSNSRIKYYTDDYSCSNIRESIDAIIGGGIKLHNSGNTCY